MAGIIASVAEDIRELQRLREEIAKVKKELTGINIKVDIDIKEGLEKQLQSLMSQYNNVAARISETEGKIKLSVQNINNATERIIQAQERATQAAQGSGGSTTGTQQQTANVEAQAKAYEELTGSINSVSGSLMKNIEKQVEANNAIRIYREELKKIETARKSRGNDAAYTDSEERRIQALTLAIEKNRIARNEAGLEIYAQIKIHNAAGASLNELRQQLIRMKNAYADMSETMRNGSAGKELLASIQASTKQISEIEQSMGVYSRNVGNYASGFNGLNVSVQQIVRELPAATMGLNTFFLAISNNLPILTDEIKRAKEANEALRASGQSGVPVWKQLVTSIFSWQSAMMVAITVLSMYGKDIMNWVSSLFKATEALDGLKESQLRFREATLQGRKDATAELTKMQLLYKATQDNTLAMRDRIKAVENLKSQYPAYFKQLSDEAILTGKAAQQYRQLAEDIVKAAQAKAYQKRIEENANKMIDLQRAINADTNVTRRSRGDYEEAKKWMAGKERYITSGIPGAPSEKATKTREQSALIEDYERREKALEENTKRMQILKEENERYARGIMANQTAVNNLDEKPEKQKSQRGKSLEERQSEYTALLDKQKDETIKKQRDNSYEIWQNEIDLMEEGNRKILAQIELDYDRQIAAIEDYEDKLKQEKIAAAKAAFEKNPANKGKVFDADSVDVRLTEQETELIQSMRDRADKEYGKSRQEVYKTELSAMRDYLKEYGTYQQQRLAIAEEYAEKIKEAQTEGERLSLQAEMQKALTELNFEQLKIDINWESVFGNLENMTREQLQRIKGQLRTMLNDKSLNVEQYKSVVEQIEKVNEAIVGSQDKLKTTLGLISPELQERKRIELEIADAQQRQSDLMEQQAKLAAGLALQRQNLSAALGDAGISVSSNDLTSGNAQRVLNDVGGKYGADSDIYKNVQKAFDEIAGSETALNASTQKLKGAMDDVTNSTNKLKVWSEDFGKKLSNMSYYIDLVNSNMQNLPGLLEPFGVDMESGFGQGVQELSNATQSASNAFSDFTSGNFVGAASNALSAISSLGKSVTSFIAGGGNEAEMEAEIARLSVVNEELAKSIDNLSDRISASDATNKESVESYKQALAAEKEREENQRKSIENRAAEYANSGYGFLGLGGKHSFGAYVNDNLGSGWGGWADFNRVLKEQGYNSTVNSWGGFIQLSPEEMEVLRDFSPQAWQELFSQDGHRNPLELVNEYIEMAGTIDDLTSALNEKLTGYSWEGFLDSYKSLLKDMTSSTEDFADNINDLITNALVNSFVNDELQPKIKKLYEYIAQAAEDGIDSNEKATIEQMNEDIANYGIAWRQAMVDAGMLKDGSSSTEQTATAKSIQNITQDQANEIDGRLNATQIAVEQGNELKRQELEHTSILNAKFDEMMALKRQDTDFANNILDMMANSYLELQEIRDSTGSSAKSLKSIDSNLSDVKRELKAKL